MELPTQVVGDDVKTPFIFVIDRCSQEQFGWLATEKAQSWTKRTGAEAVLLVKEWMGDVELGSV